MRFARGLIHSSPRYIAVRDDHAFVLDIPPNQPTGEALKDGTLWRAEQLGPPIPLEHVQLLTPVLRPGKIVCIGLNYRDHAAETDQALPEEPMVFAKFPSCVIGPDEPIEFASSLTNGVDIEAELAIVIGKRARTVSVDTSLEYVAGYTCLNDVSARDLQLRDGQWVRAKSLDTFCPIGPWVVSADEFGPAEGHLIQGAVSGELLQDASTSDMVFGVDHLISYLSHSFTLEAGDVIATGTPPGVGWFREPRRVLREGDIASVTIAGIGTLSNPVRLTA